MQDRHATTTTSAGPHQVAADVALNVMVKWDVKDFKTFFKHHDPSADVQIIGSCLTPPRVSFNGKLLNDNMIVTKSSFDSADQFLRLFLDAAMQAKLLVADVVEFEAHGPQSELDKIRAPLEDVIKVPVVYWAKVDGAFYVPEKLACASVAHAAHSPVSVDVYWKIKDYLEFIKGVCDFQELTKQEAEIRYYGFAMTDDTAVCKEGYDSAQGFLTHLDNVKQPFQAALQSADVSRIEVHGPSSECDKLRDPLKDFKVSFFTPLPASKSR